MENRALGRFMDNHECQLLAEMGIDGFAYITAESEGNGKLSPLHLWKHSKWFPGKEEI